MGTFDEKSHFHHNLGTIIHILKKIEIKVLMVLFCVDS